MIFEATEVTVAYDKSTIQARLCSPVPAAVVVNTYEFREAEDPSVFKDNSYLLLFVLYQI